MTDKLEYVTVQSRSRPNVKHTITVVDELPRACTCKSWKYGILRVQPYACIHMGELWAARKRTANAQAVGELSHAVRTAARRVADELEQDTSGCDR